MIFAQRIYDYQSTPQNTQAIFVDRLYPRGITKETMAQLTWLKAITPSATLRRWYHQDPDARFNEFSTRYIQELQGDEQQETLAHMRMWEQSGDIIFLTAVKNPMHSHVSVLLDYLGWKATLIGKSTQ